LGIIPLTRCGRWRWMNCMAAHTAKPTRALVDVHSGAVWATTSPVAVDGESWTLVLWQLQEQGIAWQSTVSDGGRAIGEAVSTVTPQRPHQRDVWHVLHLWKPIQARLDHLVERLEQQGPVVARQAARLAEGLGLRGKRPTSDVRAHAAQLAQARYVADSLRYLSGEVHHLLEVVVLATHPGQGVVSSSVRQTAPDGMQHELKKLLTRLEAALPQLVLFAPALDGVQDHVCEQLGPGAVH